MEKGSMIGLGLCLAGVFVSATLHGINIAFLFMEFGSIIIVVFGHLGATIASYPWEATQNLGKYIGENRAEPSVSGGVLSLLGTFVGSDQDAQFRNGDPNSINMILWYLAFNGMAGDIAKHCDPPSFTRQIQ